MALTRKERWKAFWTGWGSVFDLSGQVTLRDMADYGLPVAGLSHYKISNAPEEELADRMTDEQVDNLVKEAVHDKAMLEQCYFDKHTRMNELRHWIDDLQSDMFINCVYCGHRYGPSDEVPASMADVLKEHIEQCPDHPMSELKTLLKDLELWLCEPTDIHAEHRDEMMRRLNKALYPNPEPTAGGG